MTQAIIVDHLFIRQAVCNAFGVTWDEVKCVSRDQHLVDARHAYIYLCSRFAKRKYSNVMRDVNRHRTSYYKSIENTQDKIDTLDAIVFPAIQSIINLISHEHAKQTS
jgi:chromosomal replication initiation ATPase DnaA